MRAPKWWVWRVLYRHGICEQPSPFVTVRIEASESTIDVPLESYVCTLPARHKGMHVAQGPDGAAISVWDDGAPDVTITAASDG